ncbi:aminopeptidase N [uncultured Actinomyces sp.]|uniref:aminopeptidase N n=1 Tax=uncultured Actinomyces sp. TaxID=249061 RepID=UPI00288BE6DF|nr:aminopeptidase N [uncultured Actinomyces sp.]
METLTREEALERSANVIPDEIDVYIDLSNAKSGEEAFFSKSTIRFETKSSSIFVDLVAKSVEEVRVDGAPANYEVTDTRVLVKDLPTDHPVSLEIESRCYYSTTGEGLHRYIDPEDGATYLYTQFEPTDARRAWACFDQPDLKLRWQFSVKAPSDWIILSNQPEQSRNTVGELAEVTFKRTPPLSSYITAVVAGPYARVDGGTWSGGAADGGHANISLGVYCRASLAQYLDAEDILTVTRQGLDFYHEYYGFTYPWGKYDQVFVPEYNLGAMENPGCVTFNEKMISRDTPTRAARQSRANVIFHEMCHMWFGDLVTPKWWDDLWLKESFADNQGSMGLTENTQFDTEWATFASGRKEWAYKQDQLPTTHPIAADIPDVEAAKNNFDGITYAKGAAVLKQLVAYVGKEAFFTGAREYFQKHAFGATRMQDFLEALEEASGRDNLQHWSRAWLETAGPSTLHIRRGEDGFRLEQDSMDAVTGRGALRPHRLNVGFYELTGENLVRVAIEEVTLTGSSLPLETAGNYDLVLANDDDLTYALVELDENEVTTALRFVSTIANPTSRAVVWSALWAGVRAARINPRDYVNAVASQVPFEEDDAVAGDLIGNALEALLHYMATPERKLEANSFVNHAINAIGRSDTQDRKREWALAATRALNIAGSPGEDQMQFLRDLAAANSPLLTVGPNLAWRARITLAAIGAISREDVEAYLKTDPSGEAEVFALQAISALPGRIERQKTWTRILEEDLANEKMSAMLAGLNAGSLGHGATGFAGDFFDLAAHYWDSHTIGMGRRFIAGAYPSVIDAGSPEEAAALRYMTSWWVSANENAPAALVRLMREAADNLERSFRIQTKWLTK